MQFVCQFIHDRFHGKICLGVTRCTHRCCRGSINMNIIMDDFLIRKFINIRLWYACPSCYTTCTIRFKTKGGKRTVIFGSDFYLLYGCVLDEQRFLQEPFRYPAMIALLMCLFLHSCIWWRSRVRDRQPPTDHLAA